MIKQSYRVCVILGTRPEAIKLAPVIQELQKHNNLSTCIIVTGQHIELVENVFDWFRIQPSFNLKIMQVKQTLTSVTCKILQGLEPILQEFQPHLVIVQGDTTTVFAAALAAFYQQIPVAHVEAGLRTNDLWDPFPEEVNRRLTSQVATLHFAPTAQAVENLKQSGVLGNIYQTGNTIIDAVLEVAAQSPTCDIPGLDWNRFRVILATVHRRENWGNRLLDIAEGFLQILYKFPDVALLLPLHPNPIVRNSLQSKLGHHPQVYLCEPLDYPALVGAMQRCTFLLTDSGGLQEEAPALKKPVLVLRRTTERPEAVSAGIAQLVGTEPVQIVSAASDLLQDHQLYTSMAQSINPFGDGFAARRIVELVNNFLQAEQAPSRNL
jgi:UDP-N-acetylglucosamine 2-epimerase (non-hydrolysing)